MEPLHRSFGAGAHLVLGNNGAGKTNLLEAVYLLATTRSFRASQLADCCRHGGDSFELSGEVESEVRQRLEVVWSEGRRQRAVNGRRTSLAEHLASLPVVCWTSGDAGILTGPPAARRRLLDRGVVSLRPASIEAVTRFQQALRQKRHLLQHGGSELEVWNRVFATAAAELIALRAAYTERLRDALREVLEVCRLGLPDIEISYRCSLASGHDGAAAIEAELASVSERERRQQQVLAGPHRDDLRIRWDGHDLRRVASAGERKALGLALLAAQGQALGTAGRAPTYLLDDADTELDRHRLEALWRFFGEAGQLLATSNRPQIWESLDIIHRWSCEAGRIAEL